MIKETIPVLDTFKNPNPEPRVFFEGISQQEQIKKLEDKILSLETSFAQKGISIDFKDIDYRVITPSVTLLIDGTTQTVSNTVTETSLKTTNLRFTQFIKNRTLRLRATGTYSTANGADTFTLRLLMLQSGISTSTYHTLTSTAASVTNVSWNIDWIVTVPTIGTSGTTESYVSSKINNVNKDDSFASPRTFDTTSMQQFKLTVQWSSANVNDIFKMRQYILELV